MAQSRIRRGVKRTPTNKDKFLYEDKKIEHYLFLLIYSGRHETAESLFRELKRMLPGVDPVQMDRVAHKYAKELKSAGLEIKD